VVVIPAAIRDAIAAHAREESPNESCGLVLLRDGVAFEYVRGVNKTPSPYRFELFIDPVQWADINDDDGVQQAVVHSHISAPPRPSRTDVENIGEWQGLPYLIYCVKDDDLAAWTIQDGEIAALQLSA
jgi:[CysO sulfur-carrier protein]-S-L-cysteine hydrolase